MGKINEQETRDEILLRTATLVLGLVADVDFEKTPGGEKTIVDLAKQVNEFGDRLAKKKLESGELSLEDAARVFECGERARNILDEM